MKKRAEAVNTAYDLRRVDLVALLVILGMVVMIVVQAFVKRFGNEYVVAGEALAVGVLVTLVYFLKINRFLKSLLMPLIPTVAVFAVIYMNAYMLTPHYMVCMSIVVAALYFNPKLLLTFGTIVNLFLIAVYALRPEHLLGAENNAAYFISIFLMINFEVLTLYFLTKWGREIIGNAEKSKNDLQAVFDELQLSSAVQEKRAKYMEEGVQSLLTSMDRLSQGELNLTLSLKEPGEETLGEYALLESIAAKLHESAASIRGYIGEIASVLAEVSAGNLSVFVTSEFKGDFIELKSSINSIVASLNTILADINIAAEQVAAGAYQVSDGSQAISQGATEQASSIEELIASVSEIAAQTRDNAANAHKANALSAAAMESAKRGSEQMEALEAAMKAIDEASSGIANIIRVIDDIAFQTNILALNAAVEAARAGVHGKGFGVVAEEVRNLAAKSAEAASETAALIESSVKKTEAGTRLANDTVRELGGIVEAVERAAKLVGGIAAASNEQATAILQVNRGIEQMSQVVQSNSATSEEAAAATEQLSAQAELLKAKVDRFTLARETEKAAAEKQAEPKGRSIVQPAGDFGKY